MNSTKRYIPTRVVADKKVPKRYQRSGWIVFDTKHPIASHLFVNTRKEAQSIADSRNFISDHQEDTPHSELSDAAELLERSGKP